MNKHTFLFYISLFLALISCKTKEKPSQYNYMQNVEQIATEASESMTQSTIQKGDQLLIFVSAKNMDVTKPFNQNYFGPQNGLTNTPSPTSSSGEKLYQVDALGNIDFPILGSISTSDKSLETLKGELTERITTYVKDPTVTVRLANFRVTILGEVARPGQYTIPDINSTVLNALGLAGDLTMYGKREDILIVRNVNGITTKHRINLMEADFINSDFYKLKQGDVIYVSANETKEKTSRLNPNTNTYIAIAGSIIGLAGIFITIFKK